MDPTADACWPSRRMRSDASSRLRAQHADWIHLHNPTDGTPMNARSPDKLRGDPRSGWPGHRALPRPAPSIHNTAQSERHPRPRGDEDDGPPRRGHARLLRRGIGIGADRAAHRLDERLLMLRNRARIQGRDLGGQIRFEFHPMEIASSNPGVGQRKSEFKPQNTRSQLASQRRRTETAARAKVGSAKGGATTARWCWPCWLVAGRAPV